MIYLALIEVTVHGKMSMEENFVVFVVFHLTVNLFPQIMALLISNILYKYTELLQMFYCE